MTRRTAAEIQAERDQALASLDEVVRAASAEVADSSAQGLAYHTEMEEIDETIERLRQRRVELYRLKQAHTGYHMRIRLAAFTRVNDLCNTGQVAPSRRLVIAAQVVYGSGNPAITTALREGRKLLRTLDYEPFLCCGYVRQMRHGMWGGALTAGSPRVDLVGGEFCVVLPLVFGREKDQCNVPLQSLAERSDAEYVSTAQVFIGEEGIMAGLTERLKGVSVDSQDYANVLAALQDAGFGQDRSKTMLTAAIGN